MNTENKLPEPKEYSIHSFEDLCNVITVENKDRLLVDVVNAFSGYLQMVEELRAALPDETKGLKNWEISEYGFVWVDDGGNKVLGSRIETADGKFKAEIKF